MSCLSEFWVWLLFVAAIPGIATSILFLSMIIHGLVMWWEDSRRRKRRHQ